MKIRPSNRALPCLAFAVQTLFPAPAPAQQPDLRALEHRFGTGLSARPIARGARGFELIGSAAVSPPIPSATEARAAARQVIDKARDSLEAQPSELVELDLLELAGTFALRYEQRLDGLPVVGSRVDVRLSRAGELVLLRASGLARGPLSGSFEVARGDAGDLARVSIVERPIERLWAYGARAVAFSSDGRLRRAWQVEVADPASADGGWLVTVDGEKGSTLEIRPRSLSDVGGTIDGRGTASGPHGIGATTPIPLSSLSVPSVDPAIAFVELTHNGCRDEQAVISADGSTVAYVSNCDGDREICVVRSDGSGFLQLTSNGADDHSPAISADGSRVVFVSNVDGDEEIFTVKTDGTGLLQLTSNTVADRAPSLSADGMRVAYQSALGGDWEIFRVETSGTVPVALISNTATDRDPSISGDGSKIAWISDVDGDAEVWVMDWSGGSPLQLTSNSVEDLEPSLAYDASTVVFGSRLPSEDTSATDPSSGGTALGAFRSAGNRLRRVPEEIDLFEIRIDGTNLRRLSAGDGNEDLPRYASSGPWISYAVPAKREVDLLETASGRSLRLSSSASTTPRPSVSADWRNGVFTDDDGDLEIRAWHLGTAGASAITTTDATGHYSLPVPDGSGASLFLQLVGSFANVKEIHPDASRLVASGSATAPAVLDLRFNPTGDAELDTSQVTAYVHTTKAHDEVAAILTRPPLSIAGPLPIDIPLKSRVDSPTPIPNAFYNSQRQDTTYFVSAGPARPNTAYDSVIYHEYGHFLDDVFGGIGTMSPCESSFGTSEGIGDVLATFFTGSPVVGEDFFGPGTSLRDYSKFPGEAGASGAKGRQYDCKDCPTLEGKPEPHAHGEAFAGFAWDLREDLGTPLAEDLVFGALTENPPSMQAAVTEVFLLASALYGGTPATSPYYDSICLAAAKHGFDCVPRGDFGALGCTFSVCGGPEAIHRTTGTEWLGATVDWETTCEAPPDDGAIVPEVIVSGSTVPITVMLKVNPALQGSGRYGAPPPAPQLPARRVYLNAWLLIDTGGGVFITAKVLGSGSPNSAHGPDNIEPLNSVAFNPDNWDDDSYVFPFTFTVPTVSSPRVAILRFRVDWGEDAGRIDTCPSDPLYVEACGPARFGEVEDYQVLIDLP